MINKRRQAIADMVNQLGEVTLTQLKDAFPEVSEVTLRTDLRYLDETQQLLRIHGGAKSIPYAIGRLNNFSTRANLHQKEKALIASKAISLIKPGDSIFITAGSSCAELARQLPDFPLFIFTDGVGTLLEIPNHPNYSVELLGGPYEFNRMRCIGPAVTAAIENLRFNTAFIGTTGFHPSYGFGHLSGLVIDTISKVIEHSEKVVLLMDSSKINYSVAPRALPIESIDIIVSDDMIEPEIADLLKDRGITLL